MIKVGIYSLDSKQKKEIKNLIKQYFDDLDIESEISYIRNKNIALENLVEKYAYYNILLLCNEGKITYVKRNVWNLAKDYISQTIGWMDLPLSHEKIDNIIINEDYHNCPNKIFALNTKKTVRAISHGEIEYCKRNNRNTDIFLKDNETEEICGSLKSLKKQIPEDYFTVCLYGYIVNLYNIKKIDRTNRQIIMNSGHIIPITKSKSKSFVRLFIKVIFGI